MLVEKSDAALQLSLPPVTTVAPVHRQTSPGSSSVVNLSQRSHSTSSTVGGAAAPSLALVNVFSGGTSSAVTGTSRPAVTTTHTTVLHTIRPIMTQTITVCTLNDFSLTVCMSVKQCSEWG